MLIDKASDNVAITCQICHALTLTKELGVTIGNSNTNKTYEMINTTNENHIIDKHARFLNRWAKVFKKGPNKICGRQPLKNLK